MEDRTASADCEACDERREEAEYKANEKTAAAYDDKRDDAEQSLKCARSNRRRMQTARRRAKDERHRRKLTAVNEHR